MLAEFRLWLDNNGQLLCTYTQKWNLLPASSVYLMGYVDEFYLRSRKLYHNTQRVCIVGLS